MNVNFGTHSLIKCATVQQAESVRVTLRAKNKFVTFPSDSGAEVSVTGTINAGEIPHYRKDAQDALASL